jgi:hypothetical protein
MRRLSALATGLLVLAAASAHAQGLDVAVEAVQATPTTLRVGELVTVLAVVHRLDVASPHAPPVDVLVQLFLDGRTVPVSSQVVTLHPGEARNVTTRWKATAGTHAFRARITGLTTRGQRAVHDVEPSNDEARSAPVVVGSSEPSRPAPPPAAPEPPDTGARGDDEGEFTLATVRTLMERPLPR